MKFTIYRIVDNTNGNIYIGLTKQTLKQRISGHKANYRCNKGYCSSSIILENNDWYSEVIEETDDKTREAFHIQNTSKCINKIKFTYDYKEKNREYCLDNKKKIDDNIQFCAGGDKGELQAHGRDFKVYT